MYLLKLLFFVYSACAAVIEATDRTIEKLLSSDVPTVLDLYATWCSHCKQFSPIFDSLASEFEHLGDRVQFVKVNVDKNRKTSKRFNIEYIPVVKLIQGDKAVDIESRNPEDIKDIIKKNLDISPETLASSRKVKREATEGQVVDLVDDTFGDAAAGKNVLVAFTTTWCAYCKQLAPHWAELAKLYARDEDIVIANVDCTDKEVASSLMGTFKVDGFPTIALVPSKIVPGNSPNIYSGKRDVHSFVEFLKCQGVSNREVDGTLNKEAGVNHALDLSVLPDASALLKEVANSDFKYKKVYERILKKLAEKPSYLTSEIKRVESLLKADLKPHDEDAFTVKLNILQSLHSAYPKHSKDEL